MAHKSGRTSYPPAKGHPGKALPAKAAEMAKQRAFGKQGAAKRKSR